MPQWHPWECRICGARRPFVSISGTGLCPTHSQMRLSENMYGLKVKRGPAYERWLRAISRGVVREHRNLDARTDEA